MSSTTIIIKALTDLGMRQRKFASIVFAVLIVEDLFAVLMMVILSSIAINDSVEGGAAVLYSKTCVFPHHLVLVGVYLIPSILNACRRFIKCRIAAGDFYGPLPWYGSVFLSHVDFHWR